MFFPFHQNNRQNLNFSYSKMNKDKYIHFFRQMYLIRKFENLILDLFSKGEISGTTHTYMGQEAIAVGIINNLTNNQIIVMLIVSKRVIDSMT